VKAEINYDLVMDDQMGFVEGTYRLPEGDWQVFVVVPSDISVPEIMRNVRWDSGVRGTAITYPGSRNLNRRLVETPLSKVLGVTEWEEVRGPDSMQLR
jgi:hypothetical protein